MSGLLQDWVTVQAEKRPEAAALVFGKETITYGELERRSNQLARTLRGMGCDKGDRVAILLPKSPLAIVGMLGALKAGCIYVPIDASSPPARIARILDVCQPRCLLDATFSWTDVRSQSGEPLDCPTRPGDPAHILFTSGSTGIPKGVVITHSNVRHFVDWATGYFGMNSLDRNSGHSPLHFDLSTFDIYGTFACGGQLHLVPPELNLLPHKLAEFIRTSELTQWFSVPSALNYMAKFDVIRCGDFPSLKRVLWCGEVLPTPVLIHWMQRLPHAAFTNLYGPTETTIASSYYTVPRCPEDPSATIPIGTPCRGEGLLVLDEQLRPVESGELGDLYIKGVGLSPGYYLDPEKTRSAFLLDPNSSDPNDRIYKTGDLARIGPDGLVYFVGRADTQIKSRGYRIELGEISTALDALDCLQESAVVAVPSNGFEGTAICCAYVPFPDRPVGPATLKAELSKVLPAYMLPSRWMAVPALPKNPNGKTDRSKLKEQFSVELAAR